MTKPDPLYFVEPHIKRYMEEHDIIAVMGPESPWDWFSTPYAVVQASAEYSVNDSSEDVMRNLCGLFLKNLERWLNGANRIVWRSPPEVRGTDNHVSIGCRLTAYRSVVHA